MQGAVTKIGSYNGVPAFEYEIRDGDTVLAADYVIVHPKEGETWDDLSAFVRDSYLSRRVAKWALSETKEQIDRRREMRNGARLPNAAAAAIGKALPSEKHKVSYELTKEEALALQEYEVTKTDEEGKITTEAAKAFEV